ncbi:MAG: transglycosylase domain-containing protein [Pyrinomonadaceae bacterium]|nr:transglycosylase domain-containing protein [Pyrinomonadaceae bacterium]
MFGFIWYWSKIITVIIIGTLVVWVGYEVLTFPDIAKLKTENPATTSMIENRADEARASGKEPRRLQTWVSINEISPNLQRAVLAGEDTNFYFHHGFDWDAIQKAWDDARKDAETEAKKEGDNNENDWIPEMPIFKRGASTITQQLAKNLYLSTERSFLRKGREAAMTYFLEQELDKRRLLEIYLNVIEWGDGIYGAEAASQFYFKKRASALSTNEAAFLSAMIPSPLNIFNPQKNLKRVQRRQKAILRGMPFVKIPANK